MNLPALSRLRQSMGQSGADVMLIDHGELLAWLTGFTVSETLYRACLVPQQGEPWMVLRQLDEEPCRATSGLEQIVGYDDSEDPWQKVAESLKIRGYADCRLGVDFTSYGMTVFTWRQLSRHLPAVKWVAMDGVSDRLRSVKFPQELARLQQAAEIADSAMREIAQQVSCGWRVRDVAALAAHHFLQQGADTGETGPIVCAKGDNGFLHASGHEHQLQPNDLLHVELIPKVDHYSARLMRPFAMGHSSEQQQALAEQLVNVQDRQLAMMKPGATARDVDAVVRDAVLAAGWRENYPNITGYALGLYTRTPRPSDFSTCFTPTADWLLEENMVFHMYLSAQSLAFSESVVVTPSGGQRLSQLPRQLQTLM